MEIKVIGSMESGGFAITIWIDGHFHMTWLAKPNETVQDLNEIYDIDNDSEYVGPIPGIVAPAGYVILGVYKGRYLSAILLAGRGINLICASIEEVFEAIAANDTELEITPKGGMV